MTSDTQNTAPEQVWIDFDPKDWPSERVMYGDMPSPYVSYIRADIHERLMAEAVAAALEEAAHKMDMGWSYNAGNAIRALIQDPSILAKRDARIMRKVLSAADEYTRRQYGMSYLSNPVDIDRILDRAAEIEKGGG